MRYLYSFLFYLALPFIFLRLMLRSMRQPEYRHRFAERFGFYPIALDQSIWVHAVSVGETLAAIPLIKALKARYPTLPIVVTTMTPTGAARVHTAFGDTVIHLFIPYDYPAAVTRFMRSIKPAIGIIMETELWPNLLAIAKQHQVPICLVNARLSPKSARGYQRISSLTKSMLDNIDIIAAHGQPDADRFLALGAKKERVFVTGNIKFDLELPADLADKSAALRYALGRDRFIWVAASTHEGEEEMLLAAQQKLRAINPDALLILVPRHPNRFDAVAKLSEEHFATARRSREQPVTAETGVYLGDTMGELLLLYGASDVAFVGGSLIVRGGHNMLEAGALSKPIVTGPSLYNFAEISALFIEAKALTTVNDTETLTAEIKRLMENVVERIQMGQRASQVVAANRGALAKQVELIGRVIKHN